MPNAGDPFFASDYNALVGPWTPYDAAWNAATNPAINNGVKGGYVKTIGELVLFTYELTFGSTTNPGAGTWLFTLPVIPAARVSPGWVFNAHALDAGGNKYVLGCELDNVNRVRLFNPGTPNMVGPTVPFTWAVGDVLRLGGQYEPA